MEKFNYNFDYDLKILDFDWLEMSTEKLLDTNNYFEYLYAVSEGDTNVDCAKWSYLDRFLLSNKYVYVHFIASCF